MNKKLPTVITLAFFASVFVIAFTAPDVNVATYRVLGLMAFGCAASLVAIYWNRLHMHDSTYGSTPMDGMFMRPSGFSHKYRNMDSLMDKLKAMRQKRHRPAFLHH